MKINYCLPILNKTKEQVIKLINENREEYQYFEVWLDTIDGIDNIFVNKLVNTLGDKIIFLFHRGILKNPGIDPERKFQILDLLDKTQAFLDLDLSETKELDYIKNKKLKNNLIVSYHNYEETPVDLTEIIKNMDSYHPAIYKVATKCNYETDALKLLLLQQNLRIQNKRHIVLGMGEFGTITRVYGTLWGNELIYAPFKKIEETAPGQLTKQELKKIMKILVPST